MLKFALEKVYSWLREDFIWCGILEYQSIAIATKKSVYKCIVVEVTKFIVKG